MTTAVIWRFYAPLLCALLFSSGSFAQTLTNGLVGYWPMDNTQLTELTDHTSTTNHGSFVSGGPTWVAGKFGNALDVYLTTSDRATIPHHASYNASNAYSMSFWYYPIDGYRKFHHFSKGEGKVDIEASNSDLQWRHFGSPWTATGLGFEQNAEQWIHFIIIYDPYAADSNEAKKVYVQGSLIAATSTVGIATDTALNTDPIGFSSSDNGRKSSGRYDDVAIWDRALTTTEISYLYNSGAGNIVADLNPAPTAPSNVTAFASDQLAVLSWASNTVDPDAYAYNVHRGTSPGGPYTWVGTNITDTSYADTGLLNGTPYYYVIRSADLRLTESANSAEVSVTPVADSTPPAVPSGLVASDGYTRVYLSWSANGEADFAGYNVYSSLAGGGPFTIQQALVATPTWVHNGLTNGVTYYYRVTSEDYAGNESSPSAIVSERPAAFQDTNRGLVGYWPLDSDSGTTLIDASKNGNDGVFVSGTPYWTAGKLGNALAFDNDGASIAEVARISHHASYIANDTFSVSFWHQPIKCYRNGGHFGKGSFRLGAGNEKITWYSFGSQPWAASPLGYNESDGGWHLVSVVYDPSVTYGKLVYVDGSLVASNTAPAGGLDAVLNTDPIELRAPISYSYICTNRIDDVAIWDRPLTIDQIESLWNEGDGRPAYTPPPSGTVLIIR